MFIHFFRSSMVFMVLSVYFHQVRVQGIDLNSQQGQIEIIINKMEKHLDVPRLQAMINNGLATLSKHPLPQQSVMLIGDTGVGKSTLLSFLSGNQLVVRQEGLKPVLDCPSGTPITIGHQKYSETSTPSLVSVEGVAFYDCPGFNDNKGEEYEIANSFFVQRLLDTCPRVKLVLVVDQSHISEARADKLPRLTRSLLRSFGTLEGIKQGVVLIVNRADRDSSVADYHRQIEKMCGRHDGVGFVFGHEQQQFIKFLVDSDRILLFRQPSRQDIGKAFKASQSESGILEAIKKCDFIKSRHITNILSESAKLAIRDYVDEITNKSPHKIQALCAHITQHFTLRMAQISNDASSLLYLKQDVIRLGERVKSARGEQLMSVLQGAVPPSAIQQLEQDFTPIVFFCGFYNKASSYFAGLIQNIDGELSSLLLVIDSHILDMQKNRQIEIEKTKISTKNRQAEHKRAEQKQNTQKQLCIKPQPKLQASALNSAAQVVQPSLSSSFQLLQNLKDSFKQMRKQTDSLKQMNKVMFRDLQNIQTRYLSAM